jgi:hypothetical protein
MHWTQQIKVLPGLEILLNNDNMRSLFCGFTMIKLGGVSTVVFLCVRG